MSFKTPQGTFKCEKCRGRFIDEDEKLCANCQAVEDAKEEE